MKRELGVDKGERILLSPTAGKPRWVCIHYLPTSQANLVVQMTLVVIYPSRIWNGGGISHPYT